MRIIKPGFEILPRDEQRGGLAVIEAAARTCYKSEDRTTEDSAEKLVKALIDRQHEAMLEHGDYIFRVHDHHIYENICDGLQLIRDKFGKAPLLTTTNLDGRFIISGNVRAWRELLALGDLAGWYFTALIDRIYTKDLVADNDVIPDERIEQIRYADLIGRAEKLAHLRQTVRFTIDRGVSHEFVRHRVMSFAMESTRYCNYSQEKFGREITVINPCFLEEGTEGYSLWKRQCMSAEVAYFALLNFGLAPQEARTVLPHSAKTELVMTGTLGQWNHFFDLRARQVTGPAHPQAVEVAMPLMEEMTTRFPDVF